MARRKRSDETNSGMATAGCTATAKPFAESTQYYIAGDLLDDFVFVNKRIPLLVAGVTE